MSEKNGKTAGAGRGKGEGRKLSGHLKLPQQIALVEALRVHMERFQRERPTLEQAAEILSETVGFEVTRANVMSTRAALGLTWKTSQPLRRERTRAMREGMWIVAKAVAALFRRLGDEPPQELHNLIVSMAAPEGEAAGAGQG
jgi:transposase